MATDWVVYSKHCPQHTNSVIDYLARYTRRIAISNARLQQVDEQTVTLSYKDYRQAARNRQMVLSGEEFVRRFLLHILPKGLMRVRHYGFLANRCRRTRLEQITTALHVSRSTQTDEVTVTHTSAPPPVCDQCKCASMQCIGVIAPHAVHAAERLRRRC